MGKLNPIKKIDLFFTVIIISVFIIVSTIWLYNLNQNNWDSSETFFGKVKPFIVISNSMEPTIKTNAMILINKKDFNSIKKEDIIIFKKEDIGMVVHRVVTKTRDNKIITKGDNNTNIDDWSVTIDEYRGSVSKIYNGTSNTITFLFGNFMELKPLRIILVGLGVIALLVLIMVLSVILYNMIIIPFFLEKEFQKHHKLEDVTIKYYPWLEKRMQRSEIVKILEEIKEERSLTKRLVFRFHLVQWHNAMMKEEKNFRKTKKHYNRLKKVFKKEREVDG